MSFEIVRATASSAIATSGTLAVGIFHPLNVKRIASTSTATGITVQYANP